MVTNASRVSRVLKAKPAAGVRVAARVASAPKRAPQQQPAEAPQRQALPEELPKAPRGFPEESPGALTERPAPAEVSLDGATQESAALTAGGRPLPVGVIRRRSEEPRGLVVSRSGGQRHAGGAPMSLLGRHESSFEIKSFDPPGTARVGFSPAQLWPHAERAAERLGRTLTGEQRRLVRAAIDGRDALALLPAGSGQSTAFLVAAQLLEQPTLVIHPLPSWLKSQQEQLTSRGVPCVRVDAGVSGEERRRALERIRYSRSLVVLSTPGALQRAEVCRALGQSGVALAVLTDAQLFSEFSPEFGPSSASLDELLEKLGSPVAMVFSAVGSAALRADLLDGLRLREPTLFEAPLVRSNLSLAAHYVDAGERQRLLISELNRLPRPGVVICPGPREVEAVHRALGALGVASYRYHRELSAGARAAEQLHFATTNKPSVLVAESAFTGLESIASESGELPRGYGKGICRMDLRSVLHFRAPHSLEQYLRDLAL
ncbi:MAG: hypothetical protein KC492_32435, partial [Myxococcales bacterium]|nr:hypothetical protein [Myxococcales bacterium]